MKTLRTLFLEELADLYQAEQRIARTLLKFTKVARGEQLQAALHEQASETFGHVSKVARVFECFVAEPRGGKGQAMAAALADGENVVSNCHGSPTLDAAIIASVQKFEHYETGSCGCLRDWARLLENHEAESLLQEILDEKKSRDRQLTEIARARNAAALGDDEVLAHGHHAGRGVATARIGHALHRAF